MTPAEMKERRNKLHLTQAQVAEKLGITLRHYQRLESGKTPVTGAMIKLLPRELRVKRKPITVVEFRKIKHEMTLGEIASIIRAMGKKIKIQHPAGLDKPTWIEPHYIACTHGEILLQSKVPDRFLPFVDQDLLKRLAVCLYDMTDLVRRCKFDEEGQKKFDQVIEQAIDVLGDATYPVI